MIHILDSGGPGRFAIFCWDPARPLPNFSSSLFFSTQRILSQMFKYLMAALLLTNGAFLKVAKSAILLMALSFVSSKTGMSAFSKAACQNFGRRPHLLLLGTPAIRELHDHSTSNLRSIRTDPKTKVLQSLRTSRIRGARPLFTATCSQASSSLS